MENIAVLKAKDKSLSLEVFAEDNIELVQIGMNLIPIKFINLQEFERWEIIKSS